MRQAPLQNIQLGVAHVGVGLVELVMVLSRVVEVGLMVEEGVVLVLELFELDDKVELSDRDEIVPDPVPVPADEVKVSVVTVVEELCDRVMTVVELQGAVELTVDVRVKTSVLVNV